MEQQAAPQQIVREADRNGDSMVIVESAVREIVRRHLLNSDEQIISEAVGRVGVNVVNVDVLTAEADQDYNTLQDQISSAIAHVVYLIAGEVVYTDEDRKYDFIGGPRGIERLGTYRLLAKVSGSKKSGREWRLKSLGEVSDDVQQREASDPQRAGETFFRATSDKITAVSRILNGIRDIYVTARADALRAQLEEERADGRDVKVNESEIQNQAESDVADKFIPLETAIGRLRTLQARMDAHYHAWLGSMGMVMNLETGDVHVPNAGTGGVGDAVLKHLAAASSMTRNYGASPLGVYNRLMGATHTLTSGGTQQRIRRGYERDVISGARGDKELIAGVVDLFDSILREVGLGHERGEADKGLVRTDEETGYIAKWYQAAKDPDVRLDIHRAIEEARKIASAQERSAASARDTARFFERLSGKAAADAAKAAREARAEEAKRLGVRPADLPLSVGRGAAFAASKQEEREAAREKSGVTASTRGNRTLSPGGKLGAVIEDKLSDLARAVDRADAAPTRGLPVERCIQAFAGIVIRAMEAESWRSFGGSPATAVIRNSEGLNTARAAFRANLGNKILSKSAESVLIGRYFLHRLVWSSHSDEAAEDMRNAMLGGPSDAPGTEASLKVEDLLAGLGKARRSSKSILEDSYFKRALDLKDILTTLDKSQQDGVRRAYSALGMGALITDLAEDRVSSSSELWTKHIVGSPLEPIQEVDVDAVGTMAEAAPSPYAQGELESAALVQTSVSAKPGAKAAAEPFTLSRVQDPKGNEAYLQALEDERTAAQQRIVGGIQDIAAVDAETDFDDDDSDPLGNLSESLRRALIRRLQAGGRA